MKVYLIVLSFLFHLSICRDFYVGMFKRNDFLVAQDRLYKERRPYRYTVGKYGRIFKCPITFFRVVDRLGIGNGPRVQITRGGLQKKYVVAQITSSYNQPISVNIYVGCSPEKPTTTKRPPSSSEEGPIREDNASPENGQGLTTPKKEDDKQPTTAGKAAETTIAEAGTETGGNGTALPPATGK